MEKCGNRGEGDGFIGEPKRKQTNNLSPEQGLLPSELLIFFYKASNYGLCYRIIGHLM